jgi:hypothetical protein
MAYQGGGNIKAEWRLGERHRKRRAAMPQEDGDESDPVVIAALSLWLGAARWRRRKTT